MADELIETRQAFLDLTLLWEWIKGLGWKFRSNINEWPSVHILNSCRVLMNVLLERVSICNAWLQLPGIGKLSEVSDDGHHWSRLRLRHSGNAEPGTVTILSGMCVVASWLLLAPRKSLLFMNHAHN